MAHLLPLLRDPAGRIVCSECARRNDRRLDVRYLFEFADQAAFDTGEFELFGAIGDLKRQAVIDSATTQMVDVPIDAVLMCRSCHHAAAAQRIPGTLLQAGEVTIEPLRAFSPRTGEEVEVPPGRVAE